MNASGPNHDSQGRRVLFVRHGEVAERYRHLCYGRSDVELSAAGIARSRELAEQLASEPITLVCHSGLARTRILAELLAPSPEVCPLLRERDFGTWEMRTWDDLYAETGDAMTGSIHAPATWRPPGGETTFELRDRVLSWYQSLPEQGVIVAVSHGGPIAALRGTLLNAAVADWPQLIPPVGTWVEL